MNDYVIRKYKANRAAGDEAWLAWHRAKPTEWDFQYDDHRGDMGEGDYYLATSPDGILFDLWVSWDSEPADYDSGWDDWQDCYDWCRRKLGPDAARAQADFMMEPAEDAYDSFVVAMRPRNLDAEWSVLGGFDIPKEGSALWHRLDRDNELAHWIEDTDLYSEAFDIGQAIVNQAMAKALGGAA